MDETVQYINNLKIISDLDRFYLDGIGYEGVFYTIGRLSDGEIFGEDSWDLRGVEFNFANGDKDREFFSTVNDARKRYFFEKYKLRYGEKCAKCVQDLIGVPWNKIYSVVNSNLDRLKRESREIF